MSKLSQMTMMAVLLGSQSLGCTGSEPRDEPVHQDSFYLEMTVPGYASEDERQVYVQVDASLYADETVRADVGVGLEDEELEAKGYAIELKLSHGVRDQFTISHAASGTQFTAMQAEDAQEYSLTVGGAEYEFHGVRSLLADSWRVVPAGHWDEVAMMLGLTGVARRIDQKLTATAPIAACDGQTEAAHLTGIEDAEACCAIEVVAEGDVAFPWPAAVWAGVKIGAGCVALGCLVADTFRGTQCQGEACTTVWCANPGNCPNQCPNGNPDCRRP